MSKLNNFLKNNDHECSYKLIYSPLTWLGGKSKVLTHFIEHTKTSGTFYDVFGGSGVVSFNARAKKIVYNDINNDLVNFFKFVSDKSFITILNGLYENNSKEKYLSIRKAFNLSEYDVTRAAMFLYLNKCCFNGLCRYSKKTGFNSPPGNNFEKKKTPKLLIREFLKNIEKKNIKFTNLSYMDVLKNVKSGDVVYLDPPYLPSDEFKTMFTNYSSGGFTYADHLQLVSEAKRLMRLGAIVIISNSSTTFTKNLYKDAKQIIDIEVARSISSKSNGRKKVKELIAIFK